MPLGCLGVPFYRGGISFSLKGGVMDVSSLFTGVTGYLTGITLDVYTAAAAILACLGASRVVWRCSSVFLLAIKGKVRATGRFLRGIFRITRSRGTRKSFTRKRMKSAVSVKRKTWGVTSYDELQCNVVRLWLRSCPMRVAGGNDRVCGPGYRWEDGEARSCPGGRTWV